MGQSTVPFWQGQANTGRKRKKRFPEPFPNYSLEEILPLNLVGYARVLSKVSRTQESYQLSLSDEYLKKLWGCSKSTARRILNQLVDHRIVMKLTSKPVQLPGGEYSQKRILILRPITHRTHNPKVEGSNPSPATNKSVAITHVTAFLKIFSLVTFFLLTQRLTQASVI